MTGRTEQVAAMDQVRRAESVLYESDTARQWLVDLHQRAGDVAVKLREAGRRDEADRAFALRKSIAQAVRDLQAIKRAVEKHERSLR